MRLKYTIIAFLIVLSIGTVIGYKIYPKINPCPEIVSNTVVEYDTIWKTLPKDTILIPQDTIKLPGQIITIPAEVDTLAILRDYYTEYGYSWQQVDTNIVIKGYTTVKENRITSNQLNYQWLQPTVITNNTVTNDYYNYYIGFGVDMPLKTPSEIQLEALYIFKRGYLGIGYSPQLKTTNLKVGFSVINFNKPKYAKK